MAFQAGSIVADLGLNTSSFVGGMLEAQGVAALFPQVVTDFIANPLLGAAEAAKEAFEKIEAVLGGSLTEIIEHVGESLHQLSNAAIETGVSVSFLSGISAAASEAGVGTMQLAEAMNFLNRNAADAASGNKDAATAFMRLGISVTDATGQIRPTQDLLMDLADAIKSLPNAAMQAKAAMDVMGRSGADLLPFLKEGSAGIRDWIDTSNQLGATVTSNAADAADAFSKLHAYWNSFVVGIQNAIAIPALTVIEEHLPQLKAMLISVSQTVRGEIAQAFAYLSSTVVPAVVEGFNFLREHSQAVLTVLGAVGGAIAGSAIAGAFALIGPILLTVGAAIGGLATAWAALIGAFAGASIVSNSKEIFTELWQKMQEFWAWIQATAIPVIEEALPEAFDAIKPVIAGVGPIFEVLKGILFDLFSVIKNQLVPVIGQALVVAFESLKPVLAGVGAVLVSLAPLVRVLWDLFKSFGSYLIQDFSDYLKKMTPAFEAIGKTIQWLCDKLASLIGWLAKAIGKTTDFMGLTHGAADAASSISSGSSGNAGGSSGAGSSGASSSNGAASVVHVQVTIDPHKTAGEIAKAIHPAIQRAVDQVKNSTSTAMRTISQRKGL
ncbi:MAG TPA: hypothetical protein VGG19_12290 [Tepidisphaeraceae bacterium]|jgi:hypothetical protein